MCETLGHEIQRKFCGFFHCLRFGRQRPTFYFPSVNTLTAAGNTDRTGLNISISKRPLLKEFTYERLLNSRNASHHEERKLIRAEMWTHNISENGRSA
jgi:hypothetical protein